MPLSTLPEVHLGIPDLDDLELFRHGLIARDFLSFLKEPAKYVDMEGATVAYLNPAGQVLWAAERSTRPYERWHAGTGAVVPPMAIIDQPSGLSQVEDGTATIVVLASTESSQFDVDLARRSRQRAVEAGMHLVILPLGAKVGRRPEKLAQVVKSLHAIGSATDHTSPDLSPNEPNGGGLVILFTGLSGSGKSSVARALSHHLTEDCGLEVSLLAGDILRRHLSHGLTFSTADRDINVRRVGWVAAEIARHGGIAIASLIAPFDAARRDVRRMVTDGGGHFLLVHVNTPLEECERRDRKGLYARARAGLVEEFTGISSPYEQPEDADLRLDSTMTDVATLRDAVLCELDRRGWLTAPTYASTCAKTP